jgi:DNA helicase HerA-like ATPase
VRSKGVGVYFVTQNPLDIPDAVLGQLGNRVQHALRAYTPRDQKAVQAAAQTFRPNPEIDVVQVISEMGVGEALVSFMDEKGRPEPVQRAFVLPPASQIGPITADERRAVMAASLVAGVYDQTVDRESAYETLKGRAATRTPVRNEHAVPGPTPATPPPAAGPSFSDQVQDALGGLLGGGNSHRKDTVVEAIVKSAARSIGSSVGRELIRGVLGSLLKKK